MAYLNTRLGVPLWLAFAACILVGVGIGLVQRIYHHEDRHLVLRYDAGHDDDLARGGAPGFGRVPEPLNRDQPFVKLFTGTVAGIPAQFLWFIGPCHHYVDRPGKPSLRQLDLCHRRQ